MNIKIYGKSSKNDYFEGLMLEDTPPAVGPTAEGGILNDEKFKNCAFWKSWAYGGPENWPKMTSPEIGGGQNSWKLLEHF